MLSRKRTLHLPDRPPIRNQNLRQLKRAFHHRHVLGSRCCLSVRMICSIGAGASIVVLVCRQSCLTKEVNRVMALAHAVGALLTRGATVTKRHPLDAGVVIVGCLLPRVFPLSVGRDLYWTAWWI